MPRTYDLTSSLRDDTALVIDEEWRQHMRISIEGGPRSCPISLPHRNNIATQCLNFELENTGFNSDEESVFHLQGNATVLRLDGGQEVLVTAASATSRPSAGSEDSVEEDLCLKGVYLKRAVGPRQTDKQTSLGDDVTLEDMSKVEGVRWATDEETTLLAVHYYERPRNFKRGDGLVPPEHKKDALAYFANMLELAANDHGGLLKALVDDYPRYTDHYVVRLTCPGYLDGRANKGIQEEGTALRKSLKDAAVVIAKDAMGIQPTPEEQGKLSDSTDPDLPYRTAKWLDRLRAADVPLPKVKPKKKSKEAGTSEEGSLPAAEGRGRGRGRGHGRGRGRATKQENGRGGAAGAGAAAGTGVVTQGKKVEKLEKQVTQLQSEIEEKEQELSQLRADKRHIESNRVSNNAAWATAFNSMESAHSTLMGLVETSTDMRTLKKMLDHPSIQKSIAPAKRPFPASERLSLSPPPLSRQRSRTPPNTRRPYP